MRNQAREQGLDKGEHGAARTTLFKYTSLRSHSRDTPPGVRAQSVKRREAAQSEYFVLYMSRFSVSVLDVSGSVLEEGHLRVPRVTIQYSLKYRK